MSETEEKKMTRDRKALLETAESIGRKVMVEGVRNFVMEWTPTHGVGTDGCIFGLLEANNSLRPVRKSGSLIIKTCG